MNAERRKALEARGYRVYDHAGDAVGMTEEEKHLMDLRITLSNAVRKRREKQGLSQQELAMRLNVSLRRIAKIELGSWGVSIDEILNAYAIMGGRVRLEELAASSTNGTAMGKKKGKAHAK